MASQGERKILISQGACSKSLRFHLETMAIGQRYSLAWPDGRKYFITRKGQDLFEFRPTCVPALDIFLDEDIKQGSIELMIRIVGSLF